MKYEDIIEVLHPIIFWRKFQGLGVKRVVYINNLNEYVDAKGVALAVIGIRKVR